MMSKVTEVHLICITTFEKNKKNSLKDIIKLNEEYNFVLDFSNKEFILKFSSSV